MVHYDQRQYTNRSYFSLFFGGTGFVLPFMSLSHIFDKVAKRGRDLSRPSNFQTVDVTQRQRIELLKMLSSVVP